MKLQELEANSRLAIGKGLKRLRRGGTIPANLYGSKLPSVALQVDTGALEKALRMVGAGHLISLSGDGDWKGTTVLIREVQRNVLTGGPIHVDFFRVSAETMLELDIPIAIVGEAPAVKAGLGTLLLNMRTIKVDCLPADIPPSIEVDVSGLTEAGHALHVQDLKPRAGCTLKANPTEMVVKVAVHKVEEEVKPVEAKAEEAVAPAEGEEAAAQAPKATNAPKAEQAPKAPKAPKAEQTK